MGKTIKELREQYFDTALFAYINDNRLQDSITVGEKKYKIGVLENAAAVINEYYWTIVDKHLKPLIQPRSTEESNPNDVEKKVDVYKILSATEFAVMNCKPFFLLNEDGTEVDYTGDAACAREDSRVNSGFAVACALNILLNWEGYKPLVNEKLVREILDYKEHISVRDNSMTIVDEHKIILEYVNYSVSMPVLTNATWWRMFCLTAFIVSDNKISLEKYKRQQ